MTRKKKYRSGIAESIIDMMRNRAAELIAEGADEAKTIARLKRGIARVDAGSNPCIACGNEISPDERFRLDPLTETCSDACLPRAEKLSVLRQSLHDNISTLSEKNDKLREEIRQASIEQGRVETDEGAGVSSAIDDTVKAQSQNLLNEISECEAIITRIERGRYGICEECGEDIPEGRLRVRPLSIFCVRCQTEIENKEKEKKKR